MLLPALACVQSQQVTWLWVTEIISWSNYFRLLLFMWKVLRCVHMHAHVMAALFQAHLLVFSVYAVHWLNIVSVWERWEATWGLSSLVSVVMSQWLTCRYVNSQLSGPLASQSFNKHAVRTGVKWGLLQSSDGWPEKFCSFFLNFYDSLVIAALRPCKTSPCKNLIW